MIEVESLRRPFHIGHYEPPTIGAQPLNPQTTTAPLDKSRVLVHWNQEPDKGAKSDEDDDEEDEYRPFTPPPPRERLSYTRYQLELLNGIYNEVRYPNSTQKQLIAKRVGITREQVKIWFQNRRRKDVVGNGKSKPSDDSTSSISSKDSEKADDNDSSSEESASGKDSEESVVPDVVLKSVIGELIRFINDPLKGKKNRKKAKTKQKEKAAIKKGFASTLLAGGYDMISPPNQITPSAFFEKVKKGFNHSKQSSAFESPRDGPRPLQINGVSSTSDRSSPAASDSLSHSKTSPMNVSSHSNIFPNGFVPNTFNNIPLQPHPGNNLPVLSDLFAYKSCLDARQKEIMSAGNGSQATSFPSAVNSRNENERNIQPSGLALGPAPPGRYLGGIFPYPFIAEQPTILSSVRQPDQILRPSPQYALPKFGEDPYQPLMISSFPNPYFSPPSSSWTNHSMPNSTTYTNL